MRFITIYFSALLALGCNQQEPSGPQIIEPVSDTSAKITTSPKEQINSRFYTGTIPCDDCTGIEQQLLLIRNHQFRLQERFIGKNKRPDITSGTWEQNGQVYSLLVNDSIIKQYTAADSVLYILDQHGKKTGSQHPENYRLVAYNPVQQNSSWKKMQEEGIDFFVLGNEPFWSLQLDREKEMTLSLVQDSIVTIHFPYREPTAKGHSWEFKTVNGSDTLSFTISAGFCSDGMSDRWYAWQVNMHYDGHLYKGCGILLGAID